MSFGACISAAHGAGIANFDSGLPSGWTTAGTAWSVLASSGAGPVISAAQGSEFAISGGPNTVGEALTGSLTSGALTVTYDTLQWQAAGWSGQYGDGKNRFEILNASLAVVATVAAPLSDTWKTRSLNLLSVGLSAGDIFYFRAVDSRNVNGYSWLALDDLKFAGVAVSSPVPEPSAAVLLALGLPLLLALRGRRALYRQRRATSLIHRYGPVQSSWRPWALSMAARCGGSHPYRSPRLGRRPPRA